MMIRLHIFYYILIEVYLETVSHQTCAKKRATNDITVATSEWKTLYLYSASGERKSSSTMYCIVGRSDHLFHVPFSFSSLFLPIRMSCCAHLKCCFYSLICVLGKSHQRKYAAISRILCISCMKRLVICICCDPKRNHAVGDVKLASK